MQHQSSEIRHRSSWGIPASRSLTEPFSTLLRGKRRLLVLKNVDHSDARRVSEAARFEAPQRLSLQSTSVEKRLTFLTRVNGEGCTLIIEAHQEILSCRCNQYDSRSRLHAGHLICVSTRYIIIPSHDSRPARTNLWTCSRRRPAGLPVHQNGFGRGFGGVEVIGVIVAGLTGLQTADLLGLFTLGVACR